MLKIVYLSSKKPKTHQKKVNKSQINACFWKITNTDKIKNGTEEQDSKIPRMLKAKAFVGILDIQNVLHLSLSN